VVQVSAGFLDYPANRIFCRCSQALPELLKKGILQI